MTKKKQSNKLLIISSIIVSVLLIALVAYLVWPKPNYRILLNECSDYSSLVSDYDLKVIDFHSEYCIVSVKMDESMNDTIANDDRVKLLYRPLRIIKKNTSVDYDSEINTKLYFKKTVDVSLKLIYEGDIVILKSDSQDKKNELSLKLNSWFVERMNNISSNIPSDNFQILNNSQGLFELRIDKIAYEILLNDNHVKEIYFYYNRNPGTGVLSQGDNI